ncbi:putative membrane protein [Anaerobacterium chartisolvens]|uniref:Putative membrane protein n=1 Tax=Anaerobacterium chartisolvens TaxID=1297424 RepID=A0A369AL78_9FIRM|nr:YibE/F family protein [Anaerobacterium chartisolvens]RCX08164.1 putative membrane protein [Anaerobacterium chartisolvens]
MILKQAMHKSRLILVISVSVLIILFCVLLAVINQNEPTDLINRGGTEFEKAKILEVLEEDIITGTDYKAGSQKVRLEIMSGNLKGRIFETTNYISYLSGAYCEKGMTVIVTASVSGEFIVVSVYSSYRAPVLYGFIVLFLLMLWLIGRRKGLTSAIGLIFTFVCIIFMFIPMVYQGYPPFIAAVAVVILTTVVTLSLMNGFSAKSVSAMIGTVAGVIIAGIFCALVSHLAGISGYNVSEAEELAVVANQTNMQVGGILFASILIASLGAVMDVSMSVAASIYEVHINNKALSGKRLFISGMNVGRDMMGTMSNTLILAFTGRCINTLLLMYSYKTPYNQIINTYSIAIEIIQGISGSLAVILTVPIVAAISVLLIKRK